MDTCMCLVSIAWISDHFSICVLSITLVDGLYKYLRITVKIPTYNPYSHIICQRNHIYTVHRHIIFGRRPVAQSKCSWRNYATPNMLLMDYTSYAFRIRYNYS